MQVVGNGRAYEWSAPLKSFEELDREADTSASESDATRADGRTATLGTLSRTMGEDGPPLASRWSARVRGLEGRTAALVVTVAEARRRGESGRAVCVLRRLSGALGATGDALFAAVDRSVSNRPQSPAIARYVECALWWTSQLVGSLEDAVGRATAHDRDSAVVAAADFAWLYALGHLTPLRDGCGHDAVALDDLHHELMWLATSLHEEMADD